MRSFFVRLSSTFFFVGYFPIVPGTAGSFCAVLIYLASGGDRFVCAALACVALAAGFWSAGKTERLLNRKDPGCIVIDEVAGMLIAFIGVPYDYRFIILGFVFFRILDTLKPAPAGGIQGLKGSLGVMADDIVAGLYTNVILQVIAKIAS
jgi:phosphatidylglycerophosphatase A